MRVNVFDYYSPSETFVVLTADQFVGRDDDLLEQQKRDSHVCRRNGTFPLILRDAVSQLKTFVCIMNHISRSITWSLFILKASYLVKCPISTWSFIWWCQFIDYLKF